MDEQSLEHFALSILDKRIDFDEMYQHLCFWLSAGFTRGCEDRIKFLDTSIADDAWTTNHITLVMKAQKWFCLLSILRKTIYKRSCWWHSTVALWYASCSAADKRVLHWIIDAAQKIIDCSLPSLEDISNFRYRSKEENIMKASTHSEYDLIGRLPSGRCFSSIGSREKLQR